MWRETKILLIDDNAARRHELAIILNFLGEEHLACTSQDWRNAVAELGSSREVLSVLLGDVEAKGGALELIGKVTLPEEGTVGGEEKGKPSDFDARLPGGGIFEALVGHGEVLSDLRFEISDFRFQI